MQKVNHPITHQLSFIKSFDSLMTEHGKGEPSLTLNCVIIALFAARKTELDNNVCAVTVPQLLLICIAESRLEFHVRP